MIECNEIEFGKNIVMEFEYNCQEEINKPEFRIRLKTAFDKK